MASPHAHPHHDDGRWHRLRHLVGPHEHDMAGRLDQALTTSERGIRTVKLSLLILAVTAALQALLVVMTGSVALFSDTLHNGADALTALPLWLAFTVGRRAPTRRYTYGFGRAEDLAGVFVIVMIAASAVAAALAAVDRLLQPHDVSHVWVLAAAGLIGFAGNELAARYRISVGRDIGSTALVADGVHARTDGFTSLAVLAGAVGVALGFRAADPIAGLLVAAAILLVLWSAARDVYRRLMDAVDPELVERAREVVAGADGVDRVDDLRLRWIGHRLRAEVEITVGSDLDLRGAHGIAEEARHQLLHRLPRLDSAIVHVSPAPAEGFDPHRLLAHHDPGVAVPHDH